jgi:hypothetical protein
VESAAPFRLDELGTLQFERLCVELLRLETGGADSRPWGLSLVLGDGVDVPVGGRLEGPTLVLVVWLRHGSTAPSAQQRLRAVVEDAFDGRGDRPARSLLLLSNVAAARNAVPATVAAVVLGPEELWRLYASAPAVRFRVPSALGVATSLRSSPMRRRGAPRRTSPRPSSSRACSSRRAPTSRPSPSSNGTGSRF